MTGEWERIFTGHPDVVKRPVEVTARTAQRLMKIARHPVLGKAAHVQFLPSAWGTLYELTKLPEPTLRAALADGRGP
jgi:hypothetical protein